MAYVHRREFSLCRGVSPLVNASACPCCAEGRFDFLCGRAGSATTSLCGRNAVQITPADQAEDAGRVDLDKVATRLANHGTFTHNGYLLHGRFITETNTKGDPIELTLFPDGRAIIKGAAEPDAAKSIYAKYIGT